MKIKASINVKINAIIIISLLALGGVSIYITSISLKNRGESEIEGYKNAIMAEKKDMLKYLVESAYNIAESNFKESKRMTGSESGSGGQDLKNKTLNLINSLRYGRNGEEHFYVIDSSTGKILQHANNSYVGRDASSFSDTDGNKYFASQLDTARNNGEGYATYKERIRGEGQTKISYIKNFAGWNMAIATGLAIDDVEKAIEEKRNEISKNTKSQIIKLSLVVLALIIGTILAAFFIVYGGIVTPIRKMIDMLKDIAEGEGDLTKRIIDDSGDETEEMAGWFNEFVGQIQTIIKDVAVNASTLEDSSEELSELSNAMSSNVTQTSGKADSVAAAGGEMSSNMVNVAASMEQASTNVNMVAAATEEMSSTINEIAENTEKAREITGSAVQKTTTASNQVGELGRAAREIGKVVETITEISSQVDLLALNATIEAARAGDAGKGFAVVANEIKELARQTAEATMEIKNRVESIQATTDGTVTEINDVSEVVNDIDSIVSTIATAVEEQSATTNEIVNNVSQASVGLAEVNENVAQSSTVSSEIANDISEVNLSSQEIASSCDEVNKKSSELLNLAHNLGEMVNKFKV